MDEDDGPTGMVSNFEFEPSAKGSNFGTEMVQLGQAVVAVQCAIFSGFSLASRYYLKLVVILRSRIVIHSSYSKKWCKKRSPKQERTFLTDHYSKSN